MGIMGNFSAEYLVKPYCLTTYPETKKRGRGINLQRYKRKKKKVTNKRRCLKLLNRSRRKKKKKRSRKKLK